MSQVFSGAISIDSIDDPRIEVFRDVRDRDLRGRDKLFMAESELVLRRLLRTPERVHSVLLSPPQFAKLEPALHVLPDTTPVFIAELDLMTAIAGFHIHRGVLAAGLRPGRGELGLEAALGHLMDKPGFTIVAAERWTNVDNMGSLFRNVAAFGADGVLLDQACCDPLYRKAVRVSMGHVLSTPYAVADDWPAELAVLRDGWGARIVAAEATADAGPLWELPRSDRLVMVFGAEGEGLSDAMIQACDEVVQIPMAAGVPSLNVAVAAGIFLYERCRDVEGRSRLD